MEFLVERLGKYRENLKPGLNVITPFMDRIAYRVNMGQQKIHLNFPELITKDGHAVRGSANVYVKITDAAKAAYELVSLHDTLRLLISGQEMKYLVHSLTLKQALADTESLNENLLIRAKHNEEDWGISIKYIEIDKIYPI